MTEPLKPNSPPDRLYVDPNWWLFDGRITTRHHITDIDDYTRETFADEIGLAPTHLGNYLDGSRVPTLDRAQAFEAAIDDHLWHYQSVYDVELEAIAVAYKDIDGNLSAEY